MLVYQRVYDIYGIFYRGLNGLLWGCSGKIMRLLVSAVPLMYGIWIYLTIVIRVYDHGYTHL